ncbi:hypothetical protein M3Y96_00535000 [Aphelenchoides besseyi]|nr:hypothetical protein M3Y96_00535000 [Aphelenchoides besseyi]
MRRDIRAAVQLHGIAYAAECNDPMLPRCCPTNKQDIYVCGDCHRRCNNMHDCNVAVDVCCKDTGKNFGYCYKFENPDDCPDPVPRGPIPIILPESGQSTKTPIPATQAPTTQASLTRGQLTGDLRCFSDVQCGKSELICCWKPQAIHGKCMWKSEASNCKRSTIPPGVTYCYTDDHCRLSNAPSKCCGTVGETFGQCKRSCELETSTIAFTTTKIKCMSDEECGERIICCWNEDTRSGICTSSIVSMDCKRAPVTSSTTIAQPSTTVQPALQYCQDDSECRRAAGKPKCCGATNTTKGICDSGCQVNDPRCFVDLMCGDIGRHVCCWNEKRVHGMCTLRSFTQNDCDRYKPLNDEHKCYNNEQCQWAYMKPMCCGGGGDKIGRCRDSCTPDSPPQLRKFCNGRCCDLFESCQTWKRRGHCLRNVKFMWPNCPASCGWKCREDHPQLLMKISILNIKKDSVLCADYLPDCSLRTQSDSCTVDWETYRFCPLSCLLC